jgi:hypothetical protein
MNTITFTATFTFQESSVTGFAKFLGWQDQIPNPAYKDDNTQPEMIPNPVSAQDHVSILAQKYMNGFTTKWAKSLVAQAVQAQTKKLTDQITQQIVKPVEDALTVTAIINEA